MNKTLDTIVAILLLAGFIFIVMKPYFEAKAFNDCTGGNATYWTATFTELRIENCRKEN